MGKSTNSIVAIGMGILIMAVAYFGAYSQWTKLGEARSAFDVSKESNAKLKQAEADASAFLAKYENNLQEADLANRALPVGDARIPWLLHNFSQMVAESGLTLKEMNIVDTGSPEVQPEPHSIQPVDMDVQMTGTYEAFNDYLLRVQRNLRIVDLISMTVGKSQEVANDRAMLFTLKFRTYFQK
jgi:Tfp pilus assembly protein PilO